MNEHEKRLRASITEDSNTMVQKREMRDALDALMAEHKAALSAARDAALEEARVAAKRRLYELGLSASLCIEAAKIIDALKSRPAERYIPAEKMWEKAGAILSDVGSDDYERGVERGVRTLCGELGVDLDATPAKDT